MPFTKDEEKRAKELSLRIASLRSTSVKKETPSKTAKLSPIQIIEGSPQEIASKLNTLSGVLDVKVLKNLPESDTTAVKDVLKEIETLKKSINTVSKEDVVAYLKSLKGNDRLDISNIRNWESLKQKIDMNDMRWHGGGISSVSHDGTMTGDGNDVPLSVVGAVVPYFTDQTPVGTNRSLLLGDVDGVNTTFTVSQGVYATGSLEVNLNGQFLFEGNLFDFTETDPGTGTLDFIVPPPVGARIYVNYS